MEGDAVTAALIVLAALAGSIPFGLLIARARGIDIRTTGSGNIGATNVSRSLGLKVGAIVLVLDAAKGALPVWLATRGCSELGVALVGGAAILGHCFSPWLRFRGGKGVATALGVFLVIPPAATGLGVVAFALTLALTRVPALGSLVGVTTIAVTMAIAGSPTLAIFAGAVVGLLIYTHRTNLAALRRR